MKILVILILASILFGCASGPAIEEKYSAPEKIIDQKLLTENKAEIRIYRAGAFLQKLVDVKVFLNNEKAASLPNSSVSTITVSPGKHNIYAKMGGLDANSGCGFDFDIAEGEIIYMSLSPKASGALPIISVLINPMVCKFELKPVPKNQGEHDFAELQTSET